MTLAAFHNHKLLGFHPSLSIESSFQIHILHSLSDSVRMSSTLRMLSRTAPRTSITTRALHTTAAPRLPYKDSQDRESLRPGSTENTKSGRDDDAAKNPDAAFNPDKTRPETEGAAAADGTDGNPLEASGANQELSKPTGDENAKKGGAGKEINKGGASGGHSSQKGGKPGLV